MLYKLLRPACPVQADEYLARAFKLIEDVLRECRTASASLNVNGTVEWGDGGWETILEVSELSLKKKLTVAQHSTINGNRYSPRPLMDHGLVYADFYLIQFGNEALKLRPLPN